MFTRTNARKILIPYMSENWEKLENVFFKNLEAAANGKPINWKKTPSIEAVEAWNRILKRKGLN